MVAASSKVVLQPLKLKPDLVGAVGSLMLPPAMKVAVETLEPPFALKLAL